MLITGSVGIGGGNERPGIAGMGIGGSAQLPLGSGHPKPMLSVGMVGSGGGNERPGMAGIGIGGSAQLPLGSGHPKLMLSTGSAGIGGGKLRPGIAGIGMGGRAHFEAMTHQSPVIRVDRYGAPAPSDDPILVTMLMVLVAT